MKFYGEPHQLVRNTRKQGALKTFRGFRFDEHGEYETENKHVIRLLLGKFETKQTVERLTLEPNELVKPEKPEPIARHCKKCDFSCENQGEMLSHYRSAHKKGD